MRKISDEKLQCTLITGTTSSHKNMDKPVSKIVGSYLRIFTGYGMMNVYIICSKIVRGFTSYDSRLRALA